MAYVSLPDGKFRVCGANNLHGEQVAFRLCETHLNFSEKTGWRGAFAARVRANDVVSHATRSDNWLFRGVWRLMAEHCLYPQLSRPLRFKTR